MLSRFAANARLRNVGAEVITPNEASAMPPDLMKNLLFIIVYLFLKPSSRTHCQQRRTSPPSKQSPSSLPLKFRRAQNQPGNLHHRIVDRRRAHAGKLLLRPAAAATRIKAATLKRGFERIRWRLRRCGLRRWHRRQRYLITQLLQQRFPRLRRNLAADKQRHKAIKQLC